MRFAVIAASLASLLAIVPAQAQQTPPGVVPPPVQADGTPVASEGKEAKAKPAARPRGKAKLPKTAAGPQPGKPVAKRQEPQQAAAPAAPIPAIPHDEQLAIQSALMWAGDLAGSASGDDAMREAVRSFQKRKKYKVTGILTEAQRAELAAAARERESEYGWRVVIDPATGVRIGLPAKMLPHARPEGTGTRWSSTHGEVQVATFRIKAGRVTLAALFEQEKRKSSRRIESSALRDDSFSINGSQGLKNFSVRAQARDGEIRGYTILYDQMMETIVSPVASAMESTFSPFATRTAPLAAPARKVQYGSGIVVGADGYVLTDRRNTGDCQVIVAAGLGDAEPIAEDNDTGLALLRVYGARGLRAAAFFLPSRRGALTLIGIPDPQEQDGSGKPAEIKARMTGENEIELRDSIPIAGFSGAAATDEQGRVLGMVETRGAVLASTRPALPPLRLVGADAVRKFLDDNKVPHPAASAGNDVKASLVRVICVRQ
ncbi:MAG TPA: serine protease [Pseudolabrys sp.]|nr:serine protease [Pseudolabrys sp.]